MTLGNKIKTLRIEHNMTQPELANKLGVTVRTIAYYENNERQPKKSIILNISELFNVSTDYLLLHNESPMIDAACQCDTLGKKKAESFINETALLFSNGELSHEDQEKVFEAITEIYRRSKESNPKIDNK